MKWVYLYQDRNDLCKYITSDRPDEWETMMYFDFLKFLSSLLINDRDKFMFHFSFLGRVLFINLETGEWEEVHFDDNFSFDELIKLNKKEEEGSFSFSSFLKENYKSARQFFYDNKNRNIKF